MSVNLVRRAVFSLPVLGLGLFSPTADAALNRWHDVTFTPTYNDGLALLEASFEGHRMLGAVALPFFEVNGARVELREQDRLSLDEQALDGGLERRALFQVQTESGPVRVEVSYLLRDTDGQFAELGVLSARARFEGPEAEYRFFWRIDPELRGAAGDRVQVYQDSESRGYYRAPELEERVTLAGQAELGRFKVRFNDGPDFVEQSQLRLGMPAAGEATAYLLRAGSGEWEKTPGALLSGQRLQEIEVGEILPQPIEGSDQVLWYEAKLQGRSGSVGPDLFVSQVLARSAYLEMDRMSSTSFPPATYVHRGETVSVQSAYGKAGITINTLKYDAAIADRNRLNASELDAILQANTTYQAAQDTTSQWYAWLGVVKTMDIPGVLGVMYDIDGYSSDTAYREGAFAFYDSIVDTVPLLVDAGYGVQSVEEYLLWTATHELGHAFNQHHEDFTYNEDSCFYENSAIMGYSYDCANSLVWDFGPNSTTSLSSEPEEYVRPGHGVDFINSGRGVYPYNTTRAHRGGHSSTNQFSGGGCE